MVIVYLPYGTTLFKPQTGLPTTHSVKQKKQNKSKNTKQKWKWNHIFFSFLNFGAFFFTEKHKLLFFAAALFYLFIYLIIFHSIYFIKTLFVHVFWHAFLSIIIAQSCYFSLISHRFTYKPLYSVVGAAISTASLPIQCVLGFLIKLQRLLSDLRCWKWFCVPTMIPEVINLLSV